MTTFVITLPVPSSHQNSVRRSFFILSSPPGSLDAAVALHGAEGSVSQYAVTSDPSSFPDSTAYFHCNSGDAFTIYSLLSDKSNSIDFHTWNLGDP